MIGYYGTLIQFFAAIYITLSFDNILFRNIWSLNYVQIIQDRMKVLFSEKGSLFDNKIKNTIEETSSALEKKSRLRGFVCLIFSVFTLWYIGKEQTITGANLTLYHLPYTLLLLTITVVFFIVIIWVKRLLYVAFLCTLAFVVYVMSSIFDVSFLLNFDFVSRINANVDKIAPVILSLPLLYQLFVSWLYSDNYYYILGGKIKEEYNLYNKAITAQCPEEMPEEYNRAIKKAYFDKQKNSNKDTKVTNIINELYNRLQSALSIPSMWEIMSYAIRNLFRTRKDALKECISPKINGESINDVQGSSRQNNKTDVVKNEDSHIRGKQDMKLRPDQTISKIESKNVGSHIKKHDTTYRKRKY